MSCLWTAPVCICAVQDNHYFAILMPSPLRVSCYCSRKAIHCRLGTMSANLCTFSHYPSHCRLPYSLQGSSPKKKKQVILTSDRSSGIKRAVRLYRQSPRAKQTKTPHVIKNPTWGVGGHNWLMRYGWASRRGVREGERMEMRCT